VKRRDFLTLFGGAAAWPMVARAQPPAMPTVGFLHGMSPASHAPYAAAFRQGLKDTGYADGQNLAIEYRWAEGQYARLPALAVDLVGRKVAVIAATGGTVTALAAKAASTLIPIVFVTADDPVATGLVASLNRPGGNITGVSIISAALRAKNLELLHELVPTAAVFAILVNPDNPAIETQVRDAQLAASTIGRTIHILNARTEQDIDAAFASLVQKHTGALIVSTDPFFVARRDQLVALAARHAVPTVYFLREFVTGGGLMSYGTSLIEANRLSGIYAGRVLKGAKPAELPVQQSSKVELVINLKTAKALGLTFPITLLGRADEVIE
jgi:ABC-type uncharacterized transport system substrate-binding protein